MKAVIIDGSPTPVGVGLEGWVGDYAARLKENGHEVRRFKLEEMELRSCTGCWSCWWATPGCCVFKDGMEEVYGESMRSDFLIWAVPMTLGAQSAIVKKAQDRMIPLLHPYFELVEGEVHHRARYSRYPELGLVLMPGPEDDSDDVALTRTLFQRFALNFKSRLSFFATIEKDPREAADETYSD